MGRFPDEVMLHKDARTGRHEFCIVKSWCPLTLVKAKQAPDLGWHPDRFAVPFKAEKKNVRETYRCPAKKNQYAVSYLKRTLAPRADSIRLLKHEGKNVTILAALDMEETVADGVVRYLVRLGNGKMSVVRDDELMRLESHDKTKEKEN